jgi:hypothetical protein
MTTEELILHVMAHWDKHEQGCEECKEQWLALPWSTRKGIHHDYEFEKEQD